jgi:hypothetical protein
MLSPASGPAVLRRGNDMVNLYLVSLEIQPRWSGLLTRIVSDLVRRAKNTLVLYGVFGLQHLPPQMKNHGLNEEKTLKEKKNLSIESSEMNVWLVWILTSKCKSLKRVETCQKKHFTF